MDWVYRFITEKIVLKTQTNCTVLHICHNYAPSLNTQLAEFL